MLVVHCTLLWKEAHLLYSVLSPQLNLLQNKIQSNEFEDQIDIIKLLINRESSHLATGSTLPGVVQMGGFIGRRVGQKSYGY